MAKRIFDFSVSAFALMLFLPVIAVLAVMIRIKLGSPILFKQQRPGLGKNPFFIVKFRTMLDAVNVDGKLLPDADRLTPFGRFLRSTSLDELPELWNVLKGEMSLVGPRPLLMEYLPLYTAEQSRRYLVRPGVTGWAQINGRNAISWEDKFELDIWYVDNRGLLLDAKILLKTLLMVIKRHGISAEGEATMAAFKGSQESNIT